MARPSSIWFWVLFLLAISIPISTSEEELHSSEEELSTLLKIREILNFPTSMTNWSGKTNFCNTEPTSTVTIICYEGKITQLHIINGRTGSQQSPQNSSTNQRLFTTLAQLSSLKVLSLVFLDLQGPLPIETGQLSSLEILNMTSNLLSGSIPREISNLTNLQTLILDHNSIDGQIPDVLGSFASSLVVLSLRNNSLTGQLPSSLSRATCLRVLALADNYFTGQVPDLSALSHLEELYLDNNSFGPQFPLVGKKLVTLSMKRNRFRSSLSAEITTYYQLQRLDLSWNKFMGPLPVALFSLPALTFLNVAENKLTGTLSGDSPCSSELKFVNVSSNLLSGTLPKCLLSGSGNRVVLYSGNCLETRGQSQNPASVCQNEALAAGVVQSRKRPHSQAFLAILVVGITAGVLGGFVIIGFVIWMVRRACPKKQKIGKQSSVKQPQATLTMDMDNSTSTGSGYTSKLLSDARYISQTMKVGVLGVPPYRTFSLEEIEEATSNFDTSAFMGEGSDGQMYRGQLRDGSFVAVKCLKLKHSQTSQYFLKHIELISKLRHRHLVSAIGHCFEYYLDDSTVSRFFLIFEYVPNGNLRRWVSGRSRKKLRWAQRIEAAIGVARGIQFLHAGVVPGIFSNNLKITDVLLDRSFVAKISSYNLPLLSENIKKVPDQASTSSASREVKSRYEDKDIYDIGVILLELIIGVPIKTSTEIHALKNQVIHFKDSLDTVQASIAMADESRRVMVAHEVGSMSSDQSLKTVMELCIRCLAEHPWERPSIEDVIWNLQFASQVQEAWQLGDFPSCTDSSMESPASPLHPPRFKLTYQ